MSLRSRQILNHLSHQAESTQPKTMSVENVTLASGHKMPLVGFGLWKVPADKAADIVYNVCYLLSLSSIDEKDSEIVEWVADMTTILGHQTRLPSVRRCLRLPERKGGGSRYQEGHRRRSGQARGCLRHHQVVEQLPQARARVADGQGSERSLGSRLYRSVPHPLPHRPSVY